jgi:hypothetical protein
MILTTQKIIQKSVIFRKKINFLKIKNKSRLLHQSRNYFLMYLKFKLIDINFLNTFFIYIYKFILKYKVYINYDILIKHFINYYSKLRLLSVVFIVVV